MMHRFDVDVAVRFGVNAAVLFENIAYLCEYNRANGTNEHDGNFWVYNTRKAFSELYPYMTEKQVRTALDALVKENLLVKDSYNKNAFDRTRWYALTDEGRRIYLHRQIDWPSGADLIGHTGPVSLAREGQAIPDSNTDIKPNSYMRAFAKPTIPEIEDYITEMGYTVDAERFFDYYESKGWMVGKNHMKDWKASVRTWARNQHDSAPASPAPVKRKPGEYGPPDGDYWNGMTRSEYIKAHTVEPCDEHGYEIWVMPDGVRHKMQTYEDIIK